MDLGGSSDSAPPVNREPCVSSADVPGVNPEKVIRTMPSTLHTLATRSTTRQRAFSLIELLTVLGIIAIVLAIVIPVLGTARNSARKAATQSQLSDFATAISQFQISERRLPGYFSSAEMGASANQTNGFTAMDNIMLDLAGGIVTSTGPETIQVGPNAAKLVRVDPSAIGATKQTANGAAGKAYFTPDRKVFVAQTGTGQRVANAGNAALPALIDGWGQPILAWAQSETASARADFAAIASGGANPARYYWNSNSAFLSAPRLGQKGQDQANRSLLGDGAATNARVTTMQALLGSPAFPDKADATKPGAPRSPILLHSGGQNGIFLDRDSRGGKAAGTGTAAAVTYTAGQEKITGGAFEDITYTAGN